MPSSELTLRDDNPVSELQSDSGNSVFNIDFGLPAWRELGVVVVVCVICCCCVKLIWLLFVGDDDVLALEESLDEPLKNRVNAPVTPPPFEIGVVLVFSLVDNSAVGGAASLNRTVLPPLLDVLESVLAVGDEGPSFVVGTDWLGIVSIELLPSKIRVSCKKKVFKILKFRNYGKGKKY